MSDTVINEVTRATISPERVHSADLIEELLKTSEENDILSVTFMSTYLFAGKSLKDWGDHFYVKLPDNKRAIDPTTLINLHLELSTLMQQCNYLYSKASAAQSSLDGATNIKKSEILNALVEIYEKRGAKRPAAQILSHQADFLIGSAYSIVANSIVKSFFKDTRETLVELRKSLEQISILLHFEQKLQQ